MHLNLLVIRSPDMEKLIGFYSLLGLSFDYHRHGDSPFHYSAMLGKTLLEIYPLAKDQEQADKHLRLGFEIEHFEETILKLKASETLFLSEPRQTEFGYMALVSDPDGRKTELYKKEQALVPAP